MITMEWYWLIALNIAAGFSGAGLLILGIIFYFLVSEEPND